jgi:hypothetical protein
LVSADLAAKAVAIANAAVAKATGTIVKRRKEERARSEGALTGLMAQPGRPVAVGCTVSKYFEGHGTFAGTVVSIDRRPPVLYRVRFRDGDQEDMTEGEIRPLLVWWPAEPTASSRAQTEGAFFHDYEALEGEAAGSLTVGSKAFASGTPPGKPSGGGASAASCPSR